MSIEQIKGRSASHRRAICALSLSAEGRRIADALCDGVDALLIEMAAVEIVCGESIALDRFYAGLVGVYRDAGWGRMSLFDKAKVSLTATLGDVSSLRAVRATFAISRL